MERHVRTNPVFRTKLFIQSPAKIGLVYVLVGSTVRSDPAWLKDNGRVNVFENNMLLWQRV